MGDAQRHKFASLRRLGLTFSTDLMWNNYIESIVTSTARKAGSLCRPIRPILHIYKYTIHSGARAAHLKVLDNI